MTDGKQAQKKNNKKNKNEEKNQNLDLDTLRTFSGGMKDVPEFARFTPKKITSEPTGTAPVTDQKTSRTHNPETKVETDQPNGEVENKPEPKNPKATPHNPQEQKKPVNSALHIAPALDLETDVYEELERYNKEKNQNTDQNGIVNGESEKCENKQGENVIVETETNDQFGGKFFKREADENSNPVVSPTEKTGTDNAPPHLHEEPDQPEQSEQSDIPEIPMMNEENETPPETTGMEIPEIKTADTTEQTQSNYGDKKVSPVQENKTEPMPAGENLPENNEILKKLSDEISDLKSRIQGLMDTVTEIESLKNKVLTSPGILTNEKTPVKGEEPPKTMQDPIMEALEDDSGIPILQIEESDKHTEDPNLRIKERVSLKTEVDTMLENIRKVSHEKEIGYLGKLIRTNPVLYFMKPRYSEVLMRGETEPKILLGLYRIAVRFLLEDLKNKTQEAESAKSRYTRFQDQQKKMNELLGQKQQDMPEIMLPGEETPEVETLEQKREKKQKEQEMKAEYEAKIVQLTAELEKNTSEYEKLEVRFDRLQNDFNNYRNRQAKDTELQISKAREEMMLEQLKVLDNLERALEVSKTTDNLSALLKGFSMIYDQYSGILKKFQLQEIPAAELPFDPYVHEAVAQEESYMYPEGTVVMVLRKGYMIGEKVLRPAQVKTSFLPPLEP